MTFKDYIKNLKTEAKYDKKYLDNMEKELKKKKNVLGYQFEISDSGAWSWENKSNDLFVGAHIGWEGADGIDIQIYDEDGEPVHSQVIKINLTNDLKKDVDTYIKKITPILKKYK